MFGEYLRTKRRELGINQTKLGEMFGLNQKTISDYELEITSPPIATAEYMVKRLGGRLVIEE